MDYRLGGALHPAAAASPAPAPTTRIRNDWISDAYDRARWLAGRPRTGQGAPVSQYRSRHLGDHRCAEACLQGGCQAERCRMAARL